MIFHVMSLVRWVNGGVNKKGHSAHLADTDALLELYFPFKTIKVCIFFPFSCSSSARDMIRPFIMSEAEAGVSEMLTSVTEIILVMWMTCKRRHSLSLLGGELAQLVVVNTF